MGEQPSSQPKSSPPSRKGPCPCGSGRKYANCCWAKDRARDEIFEAARRSHQVIDDMLGVLLPLLESRGEHKVACKAGCNACCVSFVRITPVQTTLMADWLRQPENAHLLARFEAWLPTWRASIGDEVATIETLLADHNGLPTGANEKIYLQSIAAYERRKLMCPFNDEHGNCAVYPVRPMPCRTWNVVDTAENCGPDPKAPPVVVRHPHLSNAILDARAILDRVRAKAGLPTGERNMMNALADELGL